MRKKRKAASAALAALLGLSTFAVGPGMSTAQTVDAGKVLNQVKGDHVSKYYQGAPIDLGIANDERLIEMLKKEGKIAKGASPAEAEKALQKYLKNKQENAGKTKDQLPAGLGKAKAKENNHDVNTNGLTSGKGNKLGQAKKNKIDGVEKEEYEGDVRHDKVLVLKIDFPDYKNGSITPDETDMYYKNYSKEHFQDMIFGEDGYTGPNGDNFISMKQYYEQQSGGSYTVDGEVAGWYTADHPASYYGGNYPDENGSDARPRQLVYEALKKAAQDPNIDLSEYDVWDRDDLNGNGIYNEPDGVIDHLMVIHSGVGEEAGGGKLGSDAIWSHRWNLGGYTIIPGVNSESDNFSHPSYGDNLLVAYDYTIEPEDGAAGVFIHEFGHDLGLPDEYDTQYTGTGEAVAYWSIMASGSWAGKIGGTEPTGFSAWSKEFLQANHGGNWLSGETLNADVITSKGTEILLDEGVTKGKNNDAVRVNLPQKESVVNKPFSGNYEYHGGTGNNLNNSMLKTIDLTGVNEASLTFKTWYDIEEDWDYASVKVNGESIPGNITTDEDPAGYGHNPGHGITGKSDGWADAQFDLSAFAGEEIEVEINYWTDEYVSLLGFYVDDISIKADGNEIVSDDAEGESAFEMAGFKKDQGKFYSDHYYLLEWRSHNGVDEGLANIKRGASIMSYDPGLLVWYVDESYDNNWTGLHPGEGFLGVVDADQHTNVWSDGTVGSTRYQVHDATFSLNKSEKMFLNYPGQFTMKDNFTQRSPLFDDSADYSNKGMTHAGRNVPNYGLKFRVTGESADGTVGKVLIYK